MTESFKVTGAHAIRYTLWQLLQQGLGWDKENYNNMVPIIAPTQSPEFNETKPYIVWNYAHQMSSAQYWLRTEQAVFNIYSPDEEDVRDVINLANRYLAQEDVSANLVNTLVQAGAPASYKAFDFKWVRVVSTIGATPPDQEGGRSSGTVTLRYQFTEDSSVPTLWPTLGTANGQPVKAIW